MGMVVRTNMAAINANNSLSQASKAQQNGMQKLATGFKINKAADDASGLAISEKMKNQIKALDTAKDNCEDGANLIQTAEGYMAETHDILNRMVELSEKAANGVLANEDRSALQDEMDELCGEIDRIATTANFNGHKLLDGTLGSKGKIKLTSDSDTKTISYGIDNTFTLLKDAGGKASIEVNGDDLDGLSGKVEFSAANGDSKMTIEDDDGNTAQVDFSIKFENGATVDNANGTNQLIATIGGKKYLVGELATQNASGNAVTYTYKDGDWYNGNTKATVTAKCSANEAIAATKTTDEVPTVGEGTKLQIGESSTTADKLNVKINSFHSDSLFKGLDGFVNTTNDSDNTAASAKVKINENNSASTYNKSVSINIENQENASAAADAIRQVSSYVSDQRGKLGAQQNRLDHTVNNLTTASENVSAANSRIRDTDMAKEMMAYTSKNVIAQAAQSMLAQANSQPQNVLSLLQ